MRQSLQNKFNLLTFLVIAFFLLMLPMFSQVKADTRDSMAEAKDTAMYKWTRQLQQNWKPPNLENTEVEDYWDEYQEQAQEQNPDCGAACNRDADPDGDNMTNEEEIKAGRNPACNEEQLGADYCAGQDKFNLTKPDDVLDRAPVLLANFTVDTFDCNSQPVTTSSVECPLDPFVTTEAFQSIELILNMSNFQGVNGWDFDVRRSDGATPEWDRQPQGALAPTGSSGDYAGRFIPGPRGQYQPTLSIGSQTTAGEWHFEAWGFR